MISLHTSPLDQPGTGDAGGMNVYVVELSRRLARRASPSTSSRARPRPRCRRSSRRATASYVRHIAAGPFEGLTKGELPGQLCAFAREVLRAEASHAARPLRRRALALLAVRPGRRARPRPLGRAARALDAHDGQGQERGARRSATPPSPLARVIGEEQVVEAADLLIANTDLEAKQLMNLYDADPTRVEVVHPGVDLSVFTPAWTRRSYAASSDCPRTRSC